MTMRMPFFATFSFAIAETTFVNTVAGLPREQQTSPLSRERGFPDAAISDDRNVGALGHKREVALLNLRRGSGETRRVRDLSRW